MRWATLVFLFASLVMLPLKGFSAPASTSSAAAQPSKPKIAVLTFESKGDDELDTETLTESFQTELVNNANKDFALVERTQLFKIVEEQKLQLSGMTEADAVKIGSLAGASKIVTTKISTWEGKYIINIKCIDTSTAEITLADKLETFDKQGLMDLMTVMADRFTKKYRGENISAFQSDGKSQERVKEKAKQDNSSKTGAQSATRAERRNRDSWSPSSEIAFEVGVLKANFTSQNVTLSTNDSLWGANFNMKMPGEGFFQFIMGMSIVGGKLDKATDLTLFNFYPALLFNVISTEYIMLGAGFGYQWCFGDSTYTATNAQKYVYDITQSMFTINAELGIHLSKDIILKAEYGVNTAFAFNYSDTSSTRYTNKTYGVYTEGGSQIYVPQSVYSIRDGFSFTYWSLKIDFLM